MKRLLLSVWLLSLTLLSAVAENYPYKSDVLWVTVPNHADWLYKTGEKADHPDKRGDGTGRCAAGFRKIAGAYG